MGKYIKENVCLFKIKVQVDNWGHVRNHAIT